MAKKLKDRRDDIKGMTVTQLKDKLVSLKKEQFNLRFQTATGQSEKTSEVKHTRRLIALTKTLLRQKIEAGES